MRRNATFALLALLTAVGVVTAGVAAAGTGGGTAPTPAQTAAPTDAASNATTIDVSASGSASADPDQAVVSVAVTASAASADDARAAVAQNASALREALTDAGVASDDVETTAYRVHERTERGPDGETTTNGYEAVHAFAITVQDPERAGDVLDAAVAGGANRVDGVRFTLSEGTRADLREEAIHAAMGDARSQADAAADAADLSVTGLKTVSVGGGYGPIAYETAASGGASADRTVIDDAPVSVSVSVQATYTAA
ncbi:uncharacterized protein YggE [Halarchaeum rubridurum]|uniref:Uncharacterized protein YggE n=1 Tax=Halarchaeum rubridurum TaxID=489911 RepID=A0A830G198_9EURY|nr:SIMPL domain-containing protein [Halarchaeum rubridurum]MBP1954943.1 uncharacterized protein YggE [Halarchaeum rubridurum]GGM70198.1 hypothetical protein GCM10009017_20480 [Halarchaeum rubridurum]